METANRLWARLENAVTTNVARRPWGIGDLIGLAWAWVLNKLGSFGESTKGIGALAQALSRRAWEKFKASRLRWFVGFDLDPNAERPRSARLPFHDKEGYGVF